MSIWADRKIWEGRLVAGTFLLQTWLGGTEHSSVFLTTRPGSEPHKAAIKLISADLYSSKTIEESAQLTRWHESSNLSHPNLIRVFESGVATIDDHRFLYVLMEYAEEDLGQILPERPLSVEEVRGMLPATIGVLDFLHQSGYVHGRVKPSNVMAVNDQLKLSIDSLGKPGEHTAVKSAFDAPEVLATGLEPMSDVWSLGTTLVAMLTQHVAPVQYRRNEKSEVAIPATIAQPFQEIAQKCLRVDPKTRCALPSIVAILNGQPVIDSLAAEAPKPQAPTPNRESLPIPIPSASTRPIAKRPMLTRSTILIAIIVVLAILAIVFFMRLHRGSAQPSAPQEASAAQPQTQAASIPDAAPAPPPTSSSISPTSPPPSIHGMVRGKVLHQVLPDISKSAQNTITGHVKVNIEVSVDASGKVSRAKLIPPSASKYFTTRALEAAQKWQFTAAQVNGQPSPSEWTLRFQFGQSSEQVFPSENKP